MELLKALEIIIKDNTKKIVSEDFNGYITVADFLLFPNFFY